MALKEMTLSGRAEWLIQPSEGIEAALERDELKDIKKTVTSSQFKFADAEPALWGSEKYKKNELPFVGAARRFLPNQSRGSDYISDYEQPRLSPQLRHL